MEDPVLFDDVAGPVARASDPGTSWAAARSIARGRTESAILGVFGRGDRLTDDEISARLPAIYPPTLKSARSRLSNAGVLVDAGERRDSTRGRPMIVWERNDR